MNTWLLLDLLDRSQFGQDLQRWAVLNLVVHQFFVAVEAEVLALLGDLRLGHAEALGSAFPLALGILAPARLSSTTEPSLSSRSRAVWITAGSRPPDWRGTAADHPRAQVFLDPLGRGGH